MTRKTKIAAWVLAGLVIAAFAWRWMVFHSYYSRVKEELKLLRAEGGSEDILDLVPKPLGRRESGPIRLLKSDLLKSPYSPKAATVTDFKDPAVPDDSKVGAAYEQFRRWFSQAPAASMSVSPKIAWNDDWTPWLQKLLDRNKTVLDAAREATADDSAMFDVDWSQGYLVSFAHNKAVKETVGLLCVDAILKSRDGDMKRALESIRTAFRLRRLVDREPSINSWLVGLSCDNMPLRGLAVTLELGRADRPDIEAILAELADREDRNRITEALLGETATGLWAFRTGRRDPLSVWDAIRSFGSDAPPSEKQGQTMSFFVRLGVKAVWVWPADELNYLKTMRELRARSRLDFPAALAAPSGPSPLSSQPLASSALTRMLTPALYPCFSIVARADAQVRVARAALALYLYRNDNGTYPSSLDALAPKYLPAVPTNPVDGKPFGYKQATNGFTIYRSGADVEDSAAVSPGDIMWQHEENAGGP